MSRGVIWIEACEAWPVGTHGLAEVDGEAWSLVASESLSRRAIPEAFPSLNFDPEGTIGRGTLTTKLGLCCEEFDGLPFIRVWLDVVRAVFPGVKWQIAVPSGGPSVGVAYACLDWNGGAVSRHDQIDLSPSQRNAVRDLVHVLTERHGGTQRAAALKLGFAPATFAQYGAAGARSWSIGEDTLTRLAAAAWLTIADVLAGRVPKPTRERRKVHQVRSGGGVRV